MKSPHCVTINLSVAIFSRILYPNRSSVVVDLFGLTSRNQHISVECQTGLRLKLSAV